MIFKKKKKASSFIPPSEPLLETKEGKPDDILIHHIEEIKSMRGEIEWRVKNAYNASIVFLSAMTLAGSTFFAGDSTFVKQIKDPDIMAKVGIVALIIISAWVGVQNANHLIEKRIELYTLELMKKIANSSNGHVYYAWLGFLYGSTFFTNPISNGISKFFNASIGMFIYLLPNVVAILIFIGMIQYANIGNNLFFFSIATIFLAVSAGTTLFFFFYVMKVNKKFTEFYNNTLEPYFKKR